MKIAIASSLALLALTSPSTIDARRRDPSSYEWRTLYFVNQCNDDIDVTVDHNRHHDHTQNIRANSCEVFHNGEEYKGPYITYTEDGDDWSGISRVVSCDDMDNNACDLYGMEPNMCVITLADCGPPNHPHPHPRPPRNQQCGRKCEDDYDCSNPNGHWDSGEPWCGHCSSHDKHCTPSYDECNYDDDCGEEAVCGRDNYCVGK